MKNKSRKSKKLLVIVAMVLMIGLVAGMGAMTYSRYVTSGTSGAQSATAAKWGFVVSVDASNLFGSDYKKDGTNATAKVDGTGAVVVNGASDAIVVAPGTTGSMTISISGSAEVLAKLSITATGTTSEIHLGDYYPVKWTLNDGVTDIVSNGKLSEVVTELEGTSATFTAGTAYDKTYTLSWKWDLHVDEATDAKDTLIGYKAAGKTYVDVASTYVGSTLLSSVVATETAYDAIVDTTSFNLTISVEQIQG